MHIIPTQSPRVAALAAAGAGVVAFPLTAALGPAIFPVLGGVAVAMTAAGAWWVATTYHTATTDPRDVAPAPVEPEPLSARNGTLVPVTTSHADVTAPGPDAPAPAEDAVLELVRRAIESADHLEMLLVRARRADETLTAAELRAVDVVQDVASTFADHTEVVADGFAADGRPRGV